jgi:chemotaxis protein CheZ
VTGQRITKVVKTLKHIETTIDALLVAFGDCQKDGAIVAPPLPPEDTRSEEEKLLNGPQLPTAANNQTDIDAILAGFN